jgi:hypothetical protein
MTDKTKKIFKWSGIGAVAVGTIAIIASGGDTNVVYKVVDVVKSVIDAILGTPI